MSRILNFNLTITGDPTDKATFETALYDLAIASDYTQTVTGYRKLTPYSDSRQRIETEFYDIINSIYIIGLTIDAECVCKNTKWG